MGVMLKFVLHMMANIIWKKIGGSGAIPPVRLPKGKHPVNIPVASPWQTYIVTWMARRAWGAFGDQVKDVMAASPNGAVQKVGSWLPNPPAKPKASKPATPKTPQPPAATAPRKPQVWDSSAQPAPAPRPSPQAAPPAPASAPRAAPHYATRRLDDQDQAVAQAPQAPAAPSASAPPPAAPTPPTRPGSLLSSLRKRS